MGVQLSLLVIFFLLQLVLEKSFSLEKEYWLIVSDYIGVIRYNWSYALMFSAFLYYEEGDILLDPADFSVVATFCVGKKFWIIGGFFFSDGLSS